MKILVIGATGALGRPVVKGLLAREVAVRALNRHPEQAADLAKLGAEVVAGDLIDHPLDIAVRASGIDNSLQHGGAADHDDTAGVQVRMDRIDARIGRIGLRLDLTEAL
jgi:uncharacterized protein YbjT (DUF2867 family)